MESMNQELIKQAKEQPDLAQSQHAQQRQAYEEKLKALEAARLRDVDIVVQEHKALTQNLRAEREQSKGHHDIVMGEKDANERSVAESEHRQQVRLHELQSSVTGMFQSMEQRFESSIEKLLVRVTEVSPARSVRMKKVGRDTAPLSAPGRG